MRPEAAIINRQISDIAKETENLHGGWAHAHPPYFIIMLAAHPFGSRRDGQPPFGPVASLLYHDYRRASIRGPAIRAIASQCANHYIINGISACKIRLKKRKMEQNIPI